MKVYQLDPRHKKLLEDHSSGWWWIRSNRSQTKYNGPVIYSADFGETLKKSTLHKKNTRMLANCAFRFKRLGYIFSNVDFIKLTDKEYSVENLYEAKQIKKQLIATEKEQTKRAGILKRHNPDSKPRKQVQNPGSRPVRWIWVWSFRNKELNKEYTHIFHFVDYGAEFGFRRHKFADQFGLSYGALKSLASGGLNSYKGWERLETPQKITRAEAIAWKIELLKKGSKY